MFLDSLPALTAPEIKPRVLVKPLLEFTGPDDELVRLVKETLVPSDALLPHAKVLEEALAPLAQRSDQVSNAVADFFDGLEKLNTVATAERAAFEEMASKVRGSYFYQNDWSIAEARKFKKGGGSGEPKEVKPAETDDEPKEKKDEKGGIFTVLHQLCSPIRFPARLKDHGSSTWGLVVSVKGPDDKWQEVVLQQSELYGKGDAWVTKLVAKGLSIQGTTSQLRAILNTIVPAKQIVAIDRPGWFDIEGGGKGFMLPSGAITPTSEAVDTAYCFTGDPQMGAKFKQAGTLAEWKLNVAAHAETNTRLMLAICTALAGPLLEPLGIEGGGFHLYGSSSIGKTTALAVGASVFGHGSEFVENFRSSDNALENKCAARHHTSLFLDEIGQAKGDLGEIAYLLANGVAKARQNAGGGLRDGKSWSTPFVSTGELSFEEMIANGKKSKPTAGHAVRAVDIVADAGAGHGLFDDLCGEIGGVALSDKLKKATGAYYGTAGPAFVTWLVANRNAAQQARANRDPVEAMREKVDELASLFVANGCDGEADGQVHRVAARFALLAVAGELAREAGVVDWTKGAAIRMAFKLFSGWIKARGTSGDLEVKRGLQALQLNLSKYGMIKFDQVAARNPYNGGKTISPSDDGVPMELARLERWGYRDQDRQHVTYYVPPDVFPTLCGNHAPKKVLAALVDRKNLMTSGEGDRLTVKKQFDGVRQSYYAITIASGGFDNDGSWCDDLGYDDTTPPTDMSWLDGAMIDVTPRTLEQLSA